MTIAAFAYAYGRLALLNEAHLNNGLDLGILHQLVWRISRGSLPESSLKGFILWGDHANFLLYVLVPFYRLFPDVRTLLVSQAVAGTIAAWPLFRVAWAATRNAFFAYVILFASLLFWGLQNALDFDVHAPIFVIAPLAWFLYGLYFRRPVLTGGALAAGLLAQEDAAAMFAATGIFLLFTRRRRWGVWIALTSVVYLLVIGYLVMPRYTPGGTPLVHFDIGEYPGGPVRRTFGALTHPARTFRMATDHPEKVDTLKSLFRAWGYLPLFSPFTLVSFLPSFISRFLSLEDLRWVRAYHYNAPTFPLFAFGAILVTARISRWVTKGIAQRLTPLVASTACALLVAAGTYASSIRNRDLPLWKLANARFTDRPYFPEHAAHLVRGIRGVIPPNAAVSVASGFVGMFSNRKRVHVFPNLPSTGVPTWIVTSDQFNTWPLAKGEMAEAIDRLRSDPAYEVIWDEYAIVVAKPRPRDRGAQRPPSAPSLRAAPNADRPPSAEE
ncbi:MAG: hypothetical protein G01um101438_573 [Parcubacteria group bacterium Gr01-1014_38]|nr:MAG: hypothetical protein G01um101438_573 [Parcubacteria group bacterium Gr01-1014_38]